MTYKIIDPDDLTPGAELVLDLPNRTYSLVQTGKLGPEGVSLQALYSKFKELWLNMPYQLHPFPMYAIDAEAGKFQFGTDGTNFSGWKPLNDTTRKLQRDGGWEEYSAAGALLRVYAGVVTLGSVLATDQLYYQRTATGAAIDFNFPGPVNEGVQVYGDATNGNIDERAYLAVFTRTAGRKYDRKQLSDSGYTGTGPRLMTFAVQNEVDLKIVAADNLMTTGIYDGISITYYGADQMRGIGGVSYPFRIIIEGNGATAEQIYTKVQYLLRQNTDIDAGAGTVTGKTAAGLLSFTGDTLVTARGVFLSNFSANDTARVDIYDQNNVKRNYPFMAAGVLTFNANLVNDAAAVYRMFFKTNPAGNYGTATALTVKDGSITPQDIAGSVSGRPSIPFTFEYDSNNQGGRAIGTNAVVVVVASGKSGAKPVVTEYTITRAVGQQIALVAERERSYLNG
jgi:hypothetical protein